MSDDRCWCSCNKTVGTRLIPLNRQKHFIKEQLQIYLLFQKFVFVFGVCRSAPTLSLFADLHFYLYVTFPSCSLSFLFRLFSQSIRVCISLSLSFCLCSFGIPKAGIITSPRVGRHRPYLGLQCDQMWRIFRHLCRL